MGSSSRARDIESDVAALEIEHGAGLGEEGVADDLEQRGIVARQREVVRAQGVVGDGDVGDTQRAANDGVLGERRDGVGQRHRRRRIRTVSRPGERNRVAEVAVRSRGRHREGDLAVVEGQPVEGGVAVAVVDVGQPDVAKPEIVECVAVILDVSSDALDLDGGSVTPSYAGNCAVPADSASAARRSRRRRRRAPRRPPHHL